MTEVVLVFRMGGSRSDNDDRSDQDCAYELHASLLRFRLADLSEGGGDRQGHVVNGDTKHRDRFPAGTGSAAACETPLSRRAISAGRKAYTEWIPLRVTAATSVWPPVLRRRGLQDLDSVVYGRLRRGVYCRHGRCCDLIELWRGDFVTIDDECGSDSYCHAEGRYDDDQTYGRAVHGGSIHLCARTPRVCQGSTRGVPLSDG
jgi:hypothetical protein